MNANAEVEESSSETDSSDDERRKRKGKQICPRESNNTWSFPNQVSNSKSRSNDIKNYNTVDLGFFKDEELYDLFCVNKTKISTIEGPMMFLRHLKDHKLITDELYKKRENRDDDNGVYDALEHIQKRGAKKVRRFWKCVQQEHILQRYSQLSEIFAALKNFFNSSDLENEPSKKTQERSEDGGTKGREVKKRRTECHSVSNQAGPSSQSTKSQREKCEHLEKDSLKKALKNEPNKKTRKRSEDGGTGKERDIKKRRTEEHSVSKQAGPSSQSTNSQRKTEYVDREEEKDLWDKHKRWLPVTCGEKKAFLDREVLRRYDKKNNKCIKYHKQMITPYQYEEMAGKEKSKNWKISILCQGRKIKDLLKEGILEMPEKRKKLAINDVP